MFHKPSVFRPNFGFNSIHINIVQIGFSLIEILIAIAIISLASSLTYVGFSQFNKYQNLNANYENLRTAIKEAKANSSAQVTHKCTIIQTLIGQQIRITSPTSYRLEEVCENEDTTRNTYVVKTFNVSSDVTLSYPSSGGPFLFNVADGTVVNPGSIRISTTDGAKTQTININSNGTVQ